MRIVDLSERDAPRIAAIAAIAAIAEILVESFAESSPSYLPSTAAAREQIAESFGEGKLSRVLLTDEDEVGGWIAGAHAYSRLWELHPLVVSPKFRRRGFGRMLVQDLARQVAARGALTLYAGTSDESDRTTLFGKDLYSDPIGAMRELRATREHPIDFYLKMGFSLVGVMPDAEGKGKPSIHFALRVG
jgi:aminoglycoside 6'-N-acetyltransferase I